MPRYLYDGPVLEFERLLTDRWRAETFAPTKRKAISNLQYQFNKNNNRLPNSKITLPGNLLMVS